MKQRAGQSGALGPEPEPELELELEPELEPELKMELPPAPPFLEYGVLMHESDVGVAPLE
jgi:hypothetical protein